MPKTLEQACADLDYIRQTLEQAGTFTTLSGVGVMLVGAVGLMAAAVTYKTVPLVASVWQPQLFTRFLLVWSVAAAFAAPIAGISLYLKAAKARLPLSSGPSRRALRCMAPGWICGFLVTLALIQQHQYSFVAPAWLLFDGLAWLSAATFSIPPVRWTGWSLLCFGMLSAFKPVPQVAVLCLGGGFGLLHVVAGMYIARHYDG